MYSSVMIQYVTLLEQIQCLDPFFKTFDACEVTLKMDLKRTQKNHSNWYNSTKYFVIKTNLLSCESGLSSQCEHWNDPGF
jgi:hypothetical protein